MLREVRLLTIIIIIVITFNLFIIPQVVKTMSADVKVFNLIKFQMILLLSLLLLLLFFQLCTLLRHSVRCQWLGRPRVVIFLLICMFFYLGQTLMHLHACTKNICMFFYLGQTLMHLHACTKNICMFFYLGQTLMHLHACTKNI